LKTIALSVPNGWAVKEYLLSGFLPELAEHANVVVLSPLASDPAFRARFESDRVVVEDLRLPPLGSVEREIERFFVFAQNYRHPSVMGMNAIKFAGGKHKREQLTLKSRLRLAMVRPATQWAAKTLGRHLTIGQQLKLEQAAFSSLRAESSRLATVLSRHNVDFLFSTMPVVAYFDRPALWAAERLGLPAACVVPGWDNLFGKGRMPIHFSHFLVWSEWMGDILRSQYPEVPPARISTVGTIFLDFYFDRAINEDRTLFLRSIGGDPSRPLVVWACAPKSQTPHQPQMIEQFLEMCRHDTLAGNPQLLVRPHPVGGGAHFADFRARHPDVLFTETNADDPLSGVKWNPSSADQRMLVNSVRHADVMINFSSSITLEAFAADRPVINIAYDFAAGSDYETCTQQAYKSESYKPVVETGATRIAASCAELIAHTNAYLRNPSEHRVERARLLRLICSEVDGGAARRAAAAVLKAAGATRSAAGHSVGTASEVA
jgi:hypothetical protein